MIVLFISNSTLSYVTFFSSFSVTLLKPSIPKIEKKYIYMVVVKIHYCVQSINPTIIISNTKVEPRTHVFLIELMVPHQVMKTWIGLLWTNVELIWMLWLNMKMLELIIILKFIMLFPDERTTSFWLFVAWKIIRSKN